MPRRKKPISGAARRELARRYGCGEGQIKWAHCAYCEAPGRITWWPGRAWISFTSLEIDHVVPESKGGTGHPDNLVLACRRCNRSKGTKRFPRGQERAA